MAPRTKKPALSRSPKPRPADLLCHTLCEAWTKTLWDLFLNTARLRAVAIKALSPGRSGCFGGGGVGAEACPFCFRGRYSMPAPRDALERPLTVTPRAAANLLNDAGAR